MKRRGWVVLYADINYKLRPSFVVLGTREDAEHDARSLYDDDWEIARCTVEWEQPRRVPLRSGSRT